MSDRRKRILWVNDDPEFGKWVYDTLGQQGYEMYTAHDCEEGLRHLDNQLADLMILDITLGSSNGPEACGHIRKTYGVPLLILAGDGREEDLLQGLAHGADDYLLKPFRMEDLLGRVQVLLRRAELFAARPQPAIYSDQHLTIRLSGRRITVAGELIRLTPTEYRLLACLVENDGQAVAHTTLLERVWGPEHATDVDYVRIYIWRLRQKIEEDPRRPRYIRTEHGFGYRFERAN